ncbi:MAG: acetamidase/formamidase family protein [Defluviitaleaceae bacterium]|nr:acetamidase/formamidase family protein [Defluviitaleaceae bacterium]
MYTISKDKVIYAMSAENKPVLYADAGAQIRFETEDALHGQIKTADGGFDGLDWSRVNPATGPVYINDAQPGDVLSVKIESIEVASSGVVVCGKGMGLLGHKLEGSGIKIMPIEGDFACFNDMRIPLNKMIGVIGVAPNGDAIPCGVPDYHGGNMDCKEIKEGATVLLPVNVPGALLSIGDLHAVMADGEIGVSGLEVSGAVVVTVDVIKSNNLTLPVPIIMNEDYVMTLASHEDLDTAVEMAVSNMVDHLVENECFTPHDAVMLVSLAGNVRICQVVDPKKTVRVEFPVRLLKGYCVISR